MLGIHVIMYLCLVAPHFDCLTFKQHNFGSIKQLFVLECSLKSTGSCLTLIKPQIYFRGIFFFKFLLIFKNKSSKRGFSQWCHRCTIFVSPNNFSVNSFFTYCEEHLKNLQNLLHNGQVTWTLNGIYGTRCQQRTFSTISLEEKFLISQWTFPLISLTELCIWIKNLYWKTGTLPVIKNNFILSISSVHTVYFQQWMLHV